MKPENILVSKSGVVKVCDFGFARTTGMYIIVVLKLGLVRFWSTKKKQTTTTTFYKKEYLLRNLLFYHKV